MGVQVIHFQFTADEYEQMIAAGILTEEDRVELVNGEIVETSPINVRHAAVVNILAGLLSDRISKDVIVSVQNPVRLDERSLPQPDLALVWAQVYRNRIAHPEPEDILLIVEVADTSLAYDRDVKLPLYARAGIAEAWLVNLADNVLEIHRRPTPGGYSLIARLFPGDTAAPSAFPDAAVPVSELLD